MKHMHLPGAFQGVAGAVLATGGQDRLLSKTELGLQVWSQ